MRCALFRLRRSGSQNVAGARELAETLKKNGSSLVGVQENLVDLVWGNDRPERPSELVKIHPDKFSGKSFQEKISDLRKELETKKKAGLVICMVASTLRSTCFEVKTNGGSHAR